MIEIGIQDGLEISGQPKDDRIIKVIYKALDDIMSYCIGKIWTDGLAEKVNNDFTSIIKDKLKDYGEFPLHITTYMGTDGKIQFVPANLFTQVFLNGYFIEPKLLVGIKKLIINGKLYEIGSFNKV